MIMAKTITISVNVNTTLERAWQTWTQPEQITKWNFASDDWECPSATNNPVTGGTFSYRMAAKDGSVGFDFAGTYSQIIPHQLIEFSLGDRAVSIKFEVVSSNETKIIEAFEIEDINSAELQRQGWQAILENYKRQAETV
jgi:uncharacterized protein YndB with AHSA1/START domain